MTCTAFRHTQAMQLLRRPLMEVDLCTQELGGAAYMDGCSFTFPGRARSCNAGPLVVTKLFCSRNELFNVCPAGQTCKVTTQKERSRSF